MCLDSDLETFLIRDRIAEARQQAARCHLAQQARATKAGTDGWVAAVIKHVARATARLRTKRRVERTVLP